MKHTIAVVRCESLLSQARGLMFSSKHNLLFVFPSTRRVHLHMWFVFFPITVVLLDKKNSVIEVARLNPFTFWSSFKKASRVLEIVDDISVVAGDLIRIVSK